MRLWTSMEDGKIQAKGKGLRVNVDKTKGM